VVEGENRQNSGNEGPGGGLKTISVIMFITLFAKLSGLLRNMVFLYLLGTETAEAAAFTFASVLPRTFLDAAFAAAISAGFIPIFNKYLEQRSREEAFDLARSFITFVALISLAVSFLGFLGAGLVSDIFFAASGDEQLSALGAGLLRIMIFTMFFTSVAFALTGLSQSLGGFYIPSIMSLLSNALILGYMWLFFEGGGVLGLALAFVAGNLLQVLIFWLPLRRRGFRFRPKFSFRNEGMRQILRLTPLVMISSWLFPLTAVINAAIASNYSPTAFVELEYASAIFLIVTGMFILSVTNVLFPKLSKEAARSENRAEFSQTLSTAISGTTFFLLPMTAGIFILRVPIVRLIYERGEFGPEATAQLAYALGILTLGIIGYGLVSILTRAFFATQDGKTPMIITIIAIALNFIVAIIFVNILGLGGPALATTVALSFAGISLYVIAARKYDIFDKATALNFAKMGLAAVVMFAVLWLGQPMLEGLHDILNIAIITIFGIFIYAALSWLLRIKEMQMVKSLIFRRKGK